MRFMITVTVRQEDGTTRNLSFAGCYLQFDPSVVLVMDADYNLIETIQTCDLVAASITKGGEHGTY